MEKLIDDGRRAWADSKFRHAIECCTQVCLHPVVLCALPLTSLTCHPQAMEMCSCNKHGERTRCSCKNFGKVAMEEASIFEVACKSCDCSIGRVFGKCDDKWHIQALDLRAACYEALHELAEARNDAEWMLELAPRSLTVSEFGIYNGMAK